ncbi:hypothetical protein ACQ86D_22535 [Streptomyces galilaeus]
MPADRHQVLVLDVNETLRDLTPLRTRFEEVGAPGICCRPGSPECYGTDSP